MLTDFLGKGWGFPICEDAKTGAAISYGEESIRQSIWIILATAPGERVMRPDFGCGIHRWVFELNDAATMGQIAKEVRKALARWEPRIDVIDVNTELRGRVEVLLINIHYRVRLTNNFFNLVYPFYLAVGSQV